MRRLGENTGVILSDPGVGHGFLGDSKTKGRTNQQNVSLLCLEGNHQEVRRHGFENKLAATKGEGGEGGFGTKRHEGLDTEQVISKGPLCGPESPDQCSVIAYKGESLKDDGYVHTRMSESLCNTPETNTTL